MNMKELSTAELKEKAQNLRSEIDGLANLEKISPTQDDRLSRQLKTFQAVQAEIEVRRETLKSSITDRSPGFDSPTFWKQTSENEILRSEVQSSSEKADMARRAVDLVEKKGGRELRTDLPAVFASDSIFADTFRAASDPAYLSAFARIICQGSSEALLKLNDEERAAVARVSRMSSRDMSLDNSGFIPPSFVDPTIMINGTGTSSSLRSVAKVVATTSENWRGVVSQGSAAQWTPELTEVGDNSPTLREISIPTHKATTFIGPVSFEILQDWNGMVDAMRGLLESARADLENEAWVNGSGTNQPFGLLTRLEALTDYHIGTSTQGEIGQVDIYSVAAAVPPRMRPSSSFVASLSVIDQVRQTQTDSVGSYLQQMGDGYGFTILGKRVVESAEFPEFVGGTNEATFLAVGDFSNYIIADRVNSARVSLVPHLFGTTNNRPIGASGIFFSFRSGGDLAITNSTTNEPGIRLLVNKTN